MYSTLEDAVLIFLSSSQFDHDQVESEVDYLPNTALEVKFS